MPFKVTHFGTNRKLICDFPLVTNTISLCFQVTADYWSNLHFRQGLPVQHIHLRWTRKFRTIKFDLQETRRICLSYCADILTDNYFVLPQCMRLTDRDGKRDKKATARTRRANRVRCMLKISDFTAVALHFRAEQRCVNSNGSIALLNDTYVCTHLQWDYSPVYLTNNFLMLGSLAISQHSKDSISPLLSWWIFHGGSAWHQGRTVWTESAEFLKQVLPHLSLNNTKLPCHNFQ